MSTNYIGMSAQADIIDAESYFEQRAVQEAAARLSEVPKPRYHGEVIIA